MKHPGTQARNCLEPFFPNGQHVFSHLHPPSAAEVVMGNLKSLANWLPSDLCDFVVIYLAQLLHAHFLKAEIKAELMISQSGSVVISPMNSPVFG